MSEQLQETLREATDKGRLIEAGWISLRIAALPPNTHEVQLREMRGAFFAGAQHLFSSIMSVLEPGAEPTDANLQRMSQIQTELDEFITVLQQQAKAPAAGNEQSAALDALRNLYRSHKRRQGGNVDGKHFMSRHVPGWIYDPKTDSVHPAAAASPIEDHLVEIMNALAGGMDQMLNPNSQDYGFALMVFPFVEGGRCNYISNASRQSMVAALKEQLARLEGQPEIVGRA